MYFNELGKIIVNNIDYDSDQIRIKIEWTKQVIASVGIQMSEVVAIALPRTEKLIITILALLESNIPFLPIDMKTPSERVSYMLENAKVSKVITISSEFTEVLQAYSCIFLDQEPSIIETQINPWRNELAYILYTSGTTGLPKAVEVTRVGLENFMDAIPEIIDFSPNKVIACFTSYTFDIFFLESVLALSRGLTVVLANEEEQNNPKKMVDLIQKHQIQMLQMTPSRMKLIWIYDKDFHCLQKVDIIMIGGEAFPMQLLQELQLRTNTKIYNMYGPTETTIWSTVSDLTNKHKVDIGQPIKNTRIYLLDEELKEVQKGEIGEICIAGSGLARGYRNNEEQTRNSFTKMLHKPSELIYRTGDLGSYDENGNLFCHGRKDNQIKLYGHRIELEDIDMNLMKADKVKLALTCYDEEAERLISFYLAEEPIDDKILMKHLNLLLPEYMIPSKYCLVDKFIYTASGKVDRKEMMKHIPMDKVEAYFDSYDEIIEARDAVTEKIIDIVKGVIQDNNITITKNTNLSDLGISSFNYIKIIVELENEFDIDIEEKKLSIKAFHEVAEFADYIKYLLPSKALIS